MRTRTLLISAILLAVALLINIPASSAAPVGIMALGDSITGSPGCWRALLWKDLTDNGYTNIDFVGTQALQGCAFPYDGEHEGHGGALATTVADSNQLPGWLAATHPDIVLMHFGTNDVWSNRSTQQILAAFTTLVEQMRRNNEEMVILVAQIIPVAPDSCPECPQRTIDLNLAIPSWAQDLSTSRSPIVVVDQWRGFNAAADTWDGVHPNDTGIRKIADRWYGPLSEVLAEMNGSPETPEDPICHQSDILPNIELNGVLIQKDSVSVNVGDHLILSPQSEDDGQWSWEGPNGFVGNTRQASMENIRVYQGGIYKATFMNNCGTATIQEFEIVVTEPPVEPDPTPTPSNPGGCDSNGSNDGCGDI